MNRIMNWFAALALMFAAASCETKDVDWPEGNEPDPDNLYEIPDIAMGEYLQYNSTLGTAANALPYGAVIEQDGKYYIDKTIAARAKGVYLVKNATQIENLQRAGLTTAEQKIVNLDGIQFFTGTTKLRLTSNNVVGSLDLTALTMLDTLEMNNNYVTELKLPASVKRLRAGASSDTEAPDNRWLTSIDLSALTALEHVYLKNQHITAEGLILPTSYVNLIEMDMSGNPGAPFTIPSDLYNQLTTRDGVQEDQSGGYDGPIPQADYFEVPNVAFGEYLVYLTDTEPDASLKLPAGTALKYSNNKIYIHKATAATATTLNISKANAYITKLTNAGVASASTKIDDADGLQFFTRVQTLVATSNAFIQPLKLNTLTQLTSLTVRTAGLSTLDVSNNLLLEVLDIQGSTQAALGRLQAADLTNNTKLKTVNLSANEIVPADFKIPSSYPDLVTLNMRNNKVNDVAVTYTVPAALYNQLGTGQYDKAGLVSE